MSLKKITVNNTQTVEVLDDVVKTSKELVNSDGIWNHTRTEVASQISEMQPIIYEGDVTNAPDEEDLTSVNNQLKLKDRSTTWGMGRVILRKNLVNGVNTLTQSMLQATNTIYIIQYDFTLGEDITVPENCILEFDGGSINGNGTGKDTIIGTNSQIIAQDVAIFNNGIVIAGTWICPRIPSDWFGDVTSNNRLQQLINFSSADIDNHIVIKEGTYVVSNLQNTVAPIKPKSNTVIELLGSIQLTPNDFENGYIIGFEDNVTNVTLKGNGEIVGDYLLGHTGTTGEWGFNIELGDCSNITIDGLTIRNAWGDGICVGLGYLGAPAENIVIRNCHIHTCRRQGISVVYGGNIWINHNTINNIFGTSPQAGIDIECDQETYIHNVVVENNYVTNKCGIEVTAVANNMYDIIIRNNCIRYSKYYGIMVTTGNNILICNNYIVRVDMSVTNPTDDDSGQATKIGISATSLCIIRNNHIEGGDGKAIDVTTLVYVENNRIASATCRFENAQVLNNNIIVNGIIIKGATLKDNYIACGYNAWGFGLDIKNGIILDGNTFEYIGEALLGVVYAGTESVVVKDNILKGSTPMTLIQNNSTDNTPIIFEGNMPAVDYTDNLLYLSQAAQLKISCPAPNRGTSSERPSLNAVYAGHKYFDTTLGKPIYWNGTAWVDATGTLVQTLNN